MRVAEDSARWREIGEAYVQQMIVVIVVGLIMMMNMSLIRSWSRVVSGTK
jgi:hypothetical protein